MLCDVSTSVTSAIGLLPLGDARAARLVPQDALVRLHRAHQRGDRRLPQGARLQGRQRGDRQATPASPTSRGYTDYGRVWREFRDQVEDELHPRATVIVLGDARTNGRDPRADVFAQIAAKAGRTFWLNPEPRLYWNYGDSVIAAYEQHCEAFECWTTAQLEDFVKALARPMRPLGPVPGATSPGSPLPMGDRQFCHPALRRGGPPAGPVGHARPRPGAGHPPRRRGRRAVGPATRRSAAGLSAGAVPRRRAAPALRRGRVRAGDEARRHARAGRARTAADAADGLYDTLSTTSPWRPGCRSRMGADRRELAAVFAGGVVGAVLRARVARRAAPPGRRLAVGDVRDQRRRHLRARPSGHAPCRSDYPPSGLLPPPAGDRLLRCTSPRSRPSSSRSSPLADGGPTGRSRPAYAVASVAAGAVAVWAGHPPGPWDAGAGVSLAGARRRGVARRRWARSARLLARPLPLFAADGGPASPWGTLAREPQRGARARGRRRGRGVEATRSQPGREPGFLGAYTTFSTWMLESHREAEEGRVGARGREPRRPASSSGWPWRRWAARSGRRW